MFKVLILALSLVVGTLSPVAPHPPGPGPTIDLQVHNKQMPKIKTSVPVNPANVLNYTCNFNPQYTRGVWANNRAYFYSTGYGQASFDPHGLAVWGITSPDNKYRLVALRNGDLAMFDAPVCGGRLVWHSGTANKGVVDFVFGATGEFSIINANIISLWGVSAYQGSEAGLGACGILNFTCRYPANYLLLLNSQPLAYTHGSVFIYDHTPQLHLSYNKIFAPKFR